MPSFLSNESFPKRKTRDEWTCHPSDHYSLPTVSVLQELLPPLDVAQLQLMYVCLYW